MTTAIKIGKGTKFHAIIADGYAEWEVTKSRGRGVWEAKCLGPDWEGEIRVFTDEQIRQSLGRARMFERHADESASFYAKNLGKTIHYDNGFGEYVRCVVVMGTTVHDSKPHPCAKPVALVGNWKSHDLPRRMPNGEVYLGHQAQSIQDGKCFEPSYTCIYEGGRRNRADDVNPATLTPIDLTVPEMSAEKTAEAKLWKAVEEARTVLNSEDNYNRGPRERLEAAMKLIQGAL